MYEDNNLIERYNKLSNENNYVFKRFRCLVAETYQAFHKSDIIVSLRVCEVFPLLCLDCDRLHVVLTP